MNNWRLLLLAVVAVLQPIGSYTESNLIHGHRECCGHRSNSIAQETSLYENSRKNTPEDRRLHGDVREDRRRSDARNEQINSRERLTTERTERRLSPEFADSVKIETRLFRGQDSRLRLGDTRESRRTREDQNRRIRESLSKDSLSRYERNALDSRRTRMSHDDAWIGRVSHERVFRITSRSQDNRRALENFRRATVEAPMAYRREIDIAARYENPRDSRISTSWAVNRLQYDNNRENRNVDRRLRENENRRARSLESRINNFEGDNLRNNFRTITVLRVSTDRVFADGNHESHKIIEPLNQAYRTKQESIEVRYTSSKRHGREIRQNDERRLSLSREPRIVDDIRSERINKNNDQRQGTRDSRMSYERHERRQPLSRSLDRVMSNELRENRMSRNTHTSTLRESKDNTEQRQERSSVVNPARFELNTRSKRESRHLVHDNVRSVNRRDPEERSVSREQTFERMPRDTQHRINSQLSRASRAISNERVSRMHDGFRREAREETRNSIFEKQRLVRDISTPQRRSDTYRIQSVIPLQRARTLEDIRNEWRDVSKRDESRTTRNRITTSRLSRERIDRREAQETTRYSRADTRDQIIRHHGVQSSRVESRRQQDDSRYESRTLQRETRDILSRSTEQQYREIINSQADIRSERLSKSRDVRNTNGQDVRNDQDFRDDGSRRETRRMAENEIQPSRHNLAMDRRATHGIKIEAKLRPSDIVLDKAIRADIRRDGRETRFRSFTAQVRELEPVETSDDQSPMNWQMVFYTLQGAYLCGLLMQMLTAEKSNKGKSRWASWHQSGPKDLIKVD